MDKETREGIKSVLMENPDQNLLLLELIEDMEKLEVELHRVKQWLEEEGKARQEVRSLYIRTSDKLVRSQFKLQRATEFIYQLWMDRESYRE